MILPKNAPAMDAYWMPFTANRQFKAAPRIMAGAQGMHYTTDDGRRILDGTAGLWCVNAGHGRPEIAEAVYQQLQSLDYAPNFQIGHNPSFALAERLAAIAPAGLDRVFFTNSGSESVETALKIALAVQRARGQGARTRFIGREKGYHGVNFGGMSVGGLINNRRTFGPMLGGVDHLRHPLDIARNAFSPCLPEHGLELAEDLERLVQLHGAETIAAVIIEPVQGSAGVIIPPAGYLERIREIATKHGILLIFDEVITGFGRLGTPFASDYFGVTPDLLTAAKGLTNGCMPMGAVFADRALHDDLMNGPEAAIELFHGYTYSGHPAACAAGLATLDIYAAEGLLTRAAGVAATWQKAFHGLRDAPHVIDIRTIGLMAAVELAPRDGAAGARAYEAFVHCFENGQLVRATGDILAFSPPLIVTEAQIDELVAGVRAALATLK